MDITTKKNLLTIMLVNKGISDNNFINQELISNEDYTNEFVSYELIKQNCFNVTSKEDVEPYSLFSPKMDITFNGILKNKLYFTPYAIAYCVGYNHKLKKPNIRDVFFNKAKVKIKYTSIHEKDKKNQIDLVLSLKDFLILIFLNRANNFFNINDFYNEVNQSHLNETILKDEFKKIKSTDFINHYDKQPFINKLEVSMLSYIDDKDTFSVLTDYIRNRVPNHNYCTEKNWKIYTHEFQALKNFEEKIDFLKHNSFLRNSISKDFIITLILESLISSICYKEQLLELNKIFNKNFLQTSKLFKRVLLNSNKYIILSETNPFLVKEDFLILNEEEKIRFLTQSNSIEYLCAVCGKDLLSIVEPHHHKLLIKNLLTIKNTNNEDNIINLLLNNSNLDLTIFETFENGKEKENLLLKLLKNQQRITLLNLIEKGVKLEIDSPLLVYAKKFDKYKEISSELHAYILNNNLSNDLKNKSPIRKNKI